MLITFLFEILHSLITILYFSQLILYLVSYLVFFLTLFIDFGYFKIKLFYLLLDNWFFFYFLAFFALENINMLLYSLKLHIQLSTLFIKNLFLLSELFIKQLTAAYIGLIIINANIDSPCPICLFFKSSQWFPPK